VQSPDTNVKRKPQRQQRPGLVLYLSTLLMLRLSDVSQHLSFMSAYQHLCFISSYGTASQHLSFLSSTVLGAFPSSQAEDTFYLFPSTAPAVLPYPLSALSCLATLTFLMPPLCWACFVVFVHRDKCVWTGERRKAGPVLSLRLGKRVTSWIFIPTR
jgi:hypothetical protein